ncbi:hypothetical protein [Prosthecobacter sp.]|jgi:hypothetical protein|uniref:hypothetical protein n=1 Tax=Prosthecobacter sp. TaxID=1965333 RepID=UPI003784084E
MTMTTINSHNPHPLFAPSASKRPFRLKLVPRLPRQQRNGLSQTSQFALAAAALRQKTQDMILHAVKTGVINDAALFEQITAQAGAFNSAAGWLACHGYPAGVQSGEPMVA